MSEQPISNELEQLFRSERPRLMRFFSSHLGGDRERANDLVQESFLRLVPALRGAKPLDPVAYLQRIAVNLVRDYQRGSARSPVRLDLIEHDLRDPSASAETQLQSRQRLLQMIVVLKRLPTTTLDVFLSQRLDGLTYAAIALRTGMSISSVEKHMMRAIAHLDREMGDR